MDDKEPFLSRWSRRKLEANDDAPVALPPAAQPDVAPPAPATEPGPPESARTRSPEYRKFFDPQVDERLRHLALKGLFSNPRYNIMDGLDVYIDDYSIADPIPESMLRQLNQAKNLFLFEDEKKGETDGSADGPAESEVTASDLPAAAAAADATVPPQARPAAASDEDMDVASSAAAVPAQHGNYT
ncbi:MAG: DUF3306 domain-containing protein [Burkholderiales bacterium]|nr:DUF3306 domain-containing protein [Burkholderiales bacterium]